MPKSDEGSVFRDRFGARRRDWTKPDAFQRGGDVLRGGLGQQRRQSARKWPTATQKHSWAPYAGLWAAAVLIGGAYGAGLFDGWGSSLRAAAAIEPGMRISFGLCHTGGGYNCVVDGDTIWLKGKKIRIADIDAPETHEPRCASEKQLGDRATRRLRQLLNNGSVSLRAIDRDEDGYGRKLRVVLVDGASVGETLVGEGLARWYAGGRRPWC